MELCVVYITLGTAFLWDGRKIVDIYTEEERAKYTTLWHATDHRERLRNGRVNPNDLFSV